VPQEGVSRNSKGEAVALVGVFMKTVQQKILSSIAPWAPVASASGLNAGDRLIVEGMQEIRPGATVNPYPGASKRRRGNAKKQSARGLEMKGGRIVLPISFSNAGFRLVYCIVCCWRALCIYI
jgi:membrane fusion protein (multidrug efflux system)